MTRDEVLERLDRMASFWAESDAREGVENGPYATALRAAAEIIRESGWRPIAEAPENTYLTVGIYASFGWYEATVERDKKSAMRDGYTHFYIKPAPPAREAAK